MTIEVKERFVPLDGDRADDALAHLERLKKEYEGNANVRVAGMVETRSRGHREIKTTAKWCALIREAVRV